MRRATRLKAGWAPTVVQGDDGKPTSVPEVVLMRQSEELGALLALKAVLCPCLVVPRPDHVLCGWCAG